MNVKTVVGVGLVALVVLGVGVAAWGGPLADLRPSAISVEAQPDREARGRALLQSAYRASGGDRGYETARFEFRDHWVFPFTMFNPWPDDDQRATITLRVHSFDSTALFHNGDEAGVTWGINDWKGWTAFEGRQWDSSDAGLRFMLPTVHYFIEMPQRLTEAPIARFVETTTIDGRTYDVVFATWETPEAHDAHDQYLVYIDQESGRIGKVTYTVREIGRFTSGTCHLDDQRDVGGVWVPHQMSVTAEPTDDPDDYLHRMWVSELAWDAVPVAAVLR